MPAATNDSTTAGPALAAAARPVSTKIPVPMIAPMPSSTRSVAVSVRLRPCTTSASARRSSTDWVANSGFALAIFFPLRCGAQHGGGSVDDDGDDEPFDPVERQALDDERGGQHGGQPAQRQAQRGARVVAAEAQEARAGAGHQERA